MNFVALVTHGLSAISVYSDAVGVRLLVLSVLLALVYLLVEFKALTLFSFLFGAGVAIQTERAGGKDAYFFLRRFGALLAIGLAHMTLVWNGDILALYAVCGLLLLPLRKLPVSVLMAT